MSYRKQSLFCQYYRSGHPHQTKSLCPITLHFGASDAECTSAAAAGQRFWRVGLPVSYKQDSYAYSISTKLGFVLEYELIEHLLSICDHRFNSEWSSRLSFYHRACRHFDWSRSNEPVGALTCFAKPYSLLDQKK